MDEEGLTIEGRRAEGTRAEGTRAEGRGGAGCKAAGEQEMPWQKVGSIYIMNVGTQLNMKNFTPFASCLLPYFQARRYQAEDV
ncbi:hypothetical protein [Fischerella sp. JS2]|uniref:hypothetical protein n=1 Tax=Fischerella sp. JS2 TaxID=2597771 RepID=UPI0028E27F91|nr:hypothetical protein [Fischerella sp. JS2]